MRTLSGSFFLGLVAAFVVGFAVPTTAQIGFTFGPGDPLGGLSIGVGGGPDVYRPGQQKLHSVAPGAIGKPAILPKTAPLAPHGLLTNPKLGPHPITGNGVPPAGANTQVKKIETGAPKDHTVTTGAPKDETKLKSDAVAPSPSPTETKTLETKKVVTPSPTPTPSETPQLGDQPKDDSIKHADKPTDAPNADDRPPPVVVVPVPTPSEATPDCDGENDDDCDKPFSKLPPYVTEVDDQKKEAAKTQEPPKLTATTCTIALQYVGNDKDDPNNTTHGTNGDIAGSAKALAGTSGGQYTPVSSKDDINKAIDSFVTGGKCCLRLDIVGHGYPNGSLQLPYDIPNAQVDKDNLGGMSLTAKPAPNQKYFEAFIASLRKALCPGGKPVVTFHTCWSAEQKTSGGANIAEQVNAQGIATAGYTEKCGFGQYEEEDAKGNKTKGYNPPEPLSEPYSPSELKTFPAPGTTAPPTEKAPAPK